MVAAAPNSAPATSAARQAVLVVEEAQEPDHAPEHQGQAERVLPEVEGVDRDRAQQAHDPERAPPGAAAEPPGERPGGERAEDRPEHRQQEHAAVAAELEQRVRGVDHRQRGDVDPLAVDLERVVDRVEVALRVGRRGPVPDLGHERAVAGPSRGGWRACRRCRCRGCRADRSARGCTWRRPRAAPGRRRAAAATRRAGNAQRGAVDPRETDRTRPGWSTAVAGPPCPSFDATGADQHESGDRRRLAVLLGSREEARRAAPARPCPRSAARCTHHLYVSAQRAVHEGQHHPGRELLDARRRRAR